MDSVLPLSQLLIEPPGNLAYHLVLLFAVGGALQAALVQWQRFSYPQIQRLLKGLAALFVARLLLFAVAGIAWQGLVSAHVLMPVADRAVAALSLILLVWLWAYPEEERAGDLMLWGALTLVLLFAVGTGFWWAQMAANHAFNASLPDTVWSILNTILACVGLVIVLRRKPDGYGSGAILLAILLFGWLFHGVLPPSGGDLDGLLRLADLLAYPLIFTLPYRFKTAPVAPVRPVVEHFQSAEPDQSALQAFVRALDVPREKRCAPLAEAIARFMRADLCLVVNPPQGNRVSIACGYDLIRDLPLEGDTLFTDALPIVVRALEKRRSLRLPASSTSRDIKSLALSLSIQRTGPLLAVPLPLDSDAPLQGGVILLSPYAQHAWTAQEQEKLVQIASHIGRWLAAEQKATASTGKEEEAENRVAQLLAAVSALEEDKRRLEKELEGCAEARRRLKVLAEAYDEAQLLMERLEAENHVLDSRLKQAAEEQAKAEKSLKSALAEIARLKGQVAEALQRAQEAEKCARGCAEAGVSRGVMEHLISGAQDLRQPLSSVVGYVDLLLGGSGGELSPMQRDFLERIRSNAARLQQYLDDILRVLALEAGDLAAHPETVDPTVLLDQSLEHNFPLLQEKHQLVAVRLPDEMPLVRADSNLLRQIMQNLIRNAALATPRKGRIAVALEAVAEDGHRYLRFAVQDEGGGIPKASVAEVFKREHTGRYRLIPGLGDHGVGLPLTKALVEVQGGRIWVTSEEGKGSTFTVLLPLGEVNEKA